MLSPLVWNHNFENHRVGPFKGLGPSHLEFFSKGIWTLGPGFRISCAPFLCPQTQGAASFHLSIAGKETRKLRKVQSEKQVRKTPFPSPLLPPPASHCEGAQKSPSRNHFLFEETHNYPQWSQHHSFCPKINTSRWEWYRANLSQDLWNLHFF